MEVSNDTAQMIMDYCRKVLPIIKDNEYGGDWWQQIGDLDVNIWDDEGVTTVTAYATTYNNEDGTWLTEFAHFTRLGTLD